MSTTIPGSRICIPSTSTPAPPTKVVTARQEVLDGAYADNPERFRNQPAPSRQPPRPKPGSTSQPSKRNPEQPGNQPLTGSDKRIHRRGKQPTPGRFRTRVITAGVTPSLHVDYKHTTIKQYHKEGRALRTETTINDTRDFTIGKRLTNLPALREVGFTANRRLLRVQRLDHDPITGTTALTSLTDPVTTSTGTRVPGLRLGDPRTHALLSALVTFRTQPAGFTNADLRAITTQLRGLPPGDLSTGQVSYDLRRLRVHGLIERIPRTHRYNVTDTGLRMAMFLTRVHDRLLPTGLAHLGDPTDPAPLRAAFTHYQHQVDALADHHGLAA